MSTQNYTLPLSRWHHVADRIRAIAEAKHQYAVQTLGSTQLTAGVPVDESQIQALKARGQKALEQAREARHAQETVATIREELARLNALKGITALLAKAESTRRLIKQLKEYAAIDALTRIPVEKAAAVTKESQGGSDLFSRRSSIPVSLVTIEEIDGLSEDVGTLEAQVATITDQIADLNRTPLTIELPVTLAKAAGL